LVGARPFVRNFAKKRRAAQADRRLHRHDADYLTLIASSISFLPSGTSLANSA
jgi:hypothetical protein